MKVLFITGLYPKEYEEYFRNNIIKGSLQNAANVYQWAVVEGLYLNEADFEVISFPFLPCFPMNYKKLYTINAPIQFSNRIVGNTCRYCTFPVIKDISLVLRLYFRVKSYLKESRCESEDVVIMTYTPISWMTYALKRLKNKYKFRICSIIPDLIDDATNPVFKLPFYKYIQARIEQELVWKSYSFIDHFVLLSDYMKAKIPQSINNHVVVEGLSSITSIPEIHLKSENIKTLLYSGSLEYFTGVKNLVDAFMMIANKDYRLLICGDGPLKQYIIAQSQIDDRIFYKGVVPRDMAVKLQQESTVLINPRLPNVSLTKYSFPSKTIEYMLSGTPMIGYKLSGIPHEYYDYYYTVEDDSLVSLSDCINRVMSLSAEDLMIKGKNAQDFILMNKTSKCQVRNILDYLNYLN